MNTTETNAMAELNPGSAYAAERQKFSTSVVSGIGLSGSATSVATVGNRSNTRSGIAVLGMIQLVGAGFVSQGTGVPASGGFGGLRHESELALDRGKSIGGTNHASHESPRRYGASGECPRKIPA